MTRAGLRMPWKDLPLGATVWKRRDCIDRRNSCVPSMTNNTIRERLPCYILLREEIGQVGTTDMVHQNVTRYNGAMEEVCVKVAFLQTQPVGAFCTPLMRRVHQLWRYSAEMAFIDSSGCKDRSNWRVFVSLIYSTHMYVIHLEIKLVLYCIVL